MRDYVIIGDSCCDLTEDLRKRFNIEYVKGHIFLNGEERDGLLEWKDFSSKEFYAMLNKRDHGLTSAPANAYEYAEVYKKFASQGKDIISMSLSTGLSGTYEFSCQGRDLALEEYPEAKIICIDTLRYSVLIGMMLIYASMMREEGKTIDEVASWIEENKNRFHQMGWLDDLTFLAKQGRLSNSSAFLGQLIGIKPIGDIDYNGLTTVLGKAKGEKAGYDAILKYIDATIEEPENNIIFIGYSNRERQALKLMEMVKEKFNPKEVLISQVFPGCGINIGPGLMSAYYIGRPISKDMEFEKNLMKEILGE